MLRELQRPLFRNAYSLVLNSGATGVLGLAYWWIAARQYSPEVIGANSATIATMMFLSGVSQLSLGSALIRFIPVIGGSARHFVAISYALSVTASLLVTTIFMLGVHIWAPAMDGLNADPLHGAFFVVSVACWSLFNLEDSVLTGLRAATWVPLANVLFSVLKILLVAVFAVAIPAYGVFASWTLAVACTVIPVNVLIFKSLSKPTVDPSQHRSLRSLGLPRYLAPDYLASLCWLAPSTLLPGIITQALGATANAYFYVAWTLAYALFLISPNMGWAMVAEAASSPEKLGEHFRAVFSHSLRLLIPLGAVLVLGAPFILPLFGHEYGIESELVLRELAIAGVLHTIPTLGVCVGRALRRMDLVIGIMGSLCVLVLGLSLLFMPLFGISGVGLAWLISEAIVAIGCWWLLLRHVHSGQFAGARTSSDQATSSR